MVELNDIFIVIEGKRIFPFRQITRSRLDQKQREIALEHEVTSLRFAEIKNDINDENFIKVTKLIDFRLENESETESEIINVLEDNKRKKDKGKNENK